MEGKYMKIRFTDEERQYLEHIAKLSGKRVNEFVRNCALQFNQMQYVADIDKLEAHTKQIEGLRTDFNKLYFTSFEDKILMAGFFEQVNKQIIDVEILEAKLYRAVRNILSIMRGEPIEEGEEDDFELCGSTQHSG